MNGIQGCINSVSISFKSFLLFPLEKILGEYSCGIEYYRFDSF